MKGRRICAMDRLDYQEVELWAADRIMKRSDLEICIRMLKRLLEVDLDVPLTGEGRGRDGARLSPESVTCHQNHRKSRFPGKPVLKNS